METPKVEVLEVSPKETAAVIKDVTPNEDCQFRIRALNAAGLSEPSSPTQLIKVEDQPGCNTLFIMNFVWLLLISETIRETKFWHQFHQGHCGEGGPDL